MNGPLPKRVCALFEELASLPVREAWAVAADAIASDGLANELHPELERLTVGGIVEVLPTAPSRSRRPNLARAGIDPRERLADLTPEERRAIAEALRHGRTRVRASRVATTSAEMAA
jgi:predicted DNA binding protein